MTSLSLPVIYVSHDMAEVERLADHLVLMQAGRSLRPDRFSEVQSNPSLPLALAKDAAVSLDAVVRTYDEKYGLATLDVRRRPLHSADAKRTDWQPPAPHHCSERRQSGA